MNSETSIFIAGHNGLVGSSLVRMLAARGFTNVLTAPRKSLDLTNETQVDQFFQKQKPEYVFLAAAKVGGIRANSQLPVDFLDQNLKIQQNVIAAAYRHQTRKLMNFGSNCMYPVSAEQPYREDTILNGPVEASNQWYAIAKITGLKLAQAYFKQFNFKAITVIPASVYGPMDNFDLSGGHVLPSLINRIHIAKQKKQTSLDLWGTGTPLREFLFVDDLAEACLFLMENYDSPDPINIGPGHEISIRDLAHEISRLSGYSGELRFDTSQPDGAIRKCLDCSRIQTLGWSPKTSLTHGLSKTLRWFKENGTSARGVVV